jgi:hypothetical protein
MVIVKTSAGHFDDGSVILCLPLLGRFLCFGRDFDQRWFRQVFISGLSLSAVNAGDQPGVTANEIVVGSTFAFSGRASSLGNVSEAFMG